MRWINENKNRGKITAINCIIRRIVETTNYDNKEEVKHNSERVRNLLKAREKLYEEGKENMNTRYEVSGIFIIEVEAENEQHAGKKAEQILKDSGITGYVIDVSAVKTENMEVHHE